MRARAAQAQATPTSVYVVGSRAKWRLWQGSPVRRGRISPAGRGEVSPVWVQVTRTASESRTISALLLHGRQIGEGPAA